MMTSVRSVPPFGATLIASKRTRFRLWAPDEGEVRVVLKDVGPVPMRQTGDGWFEVEAECGPGARYRYELEDGQLVPDPASRAQEQDVHGWSIVVDPDAYAWRNAGWRGRPWPEAVLYELHVGAFGGFRAVTEHLAYLADIGVTAVELMPIAEFPGGRNWGYDGALPYAPESSYGTPEELKALVDHAHGLGLMVFLDVVYNHFGPDGNYLSLYASPFFRRDVSTPWGPAIDFRRPQVRSFFIENAIYWLQDYRFDGLRLDAAHAIPDRSFLPELAERVRSACGAGRHVHLVVENDDNDAGLLAHGFDAQWNDDFHHVMHVLLTGERDSYYFDYGADTATKLARSLCEGFVFQGEPATVRQGAPRGSASGQLPASAFVNFLQNHDQIGNRAFGERLCRLADPDALRAARTLLLLAPQVPMLFMGEEFGSDRPFLFFTSYGDEPLAEAVREGRRREFGGFAAFSSPEARAAIPDPNAVSTFEASRFAAPADDDAELAFTKQLLRTRKSISRLREARPLRCDVLGPAAVEAVWRLGEGPSLHHAVNLGTQPVDAAPLPSGADLLAETPPLAAVALRSGTLIPAAAVVWLES